MSLECATTSVGVGPQRLSICCRLSSTILRRPLSIPIYSLIVPNAYCALRTVSSMGPPRSPKTIAAPEADDLVGLCSTVPRAVEVVTRD